MELEFFYMLPYPLQIFLLAAPFVTLIILIAFMIKNLYFKVHRSSMFWLTLTFVTLGLYVYELVYRNPSELNIYKGLALILFTYNTYIDLRDTNKEKKRQKHKPHVMKYIDR